MQLPDITSIKKLGEKGKNYRVTYIEINMKLGLIVIYKICFGALKSLITRFEAVQKQLERV